MSYFLNAITDDPVVYEINMVLEDSRWEIDNTVSELTKYRLFAEETKLEFNYQTHDKYDTDEALERLQTLFQVLQSFKDRVLEIRLNCLPNKKKLSRIYEDLEAHVYKYHYDDLKDYKNQGEKSAMIRSLAPKLSSLLSDYDTLVEAANLVASNLTETHYCLCRIESLAKLVNNNRQMARRVVS